MPVPPTFDSRRSSVERESSSFVQSAAIPMGTSVQTLLVPGLRIAARVETAFVVSGVLRLTPSRAPTVGWSGWAFLRTRGPLGTAVKRRSYSTSGDGLGACYLLLAARISTQPPDAASAQLHSAPRSRISRLRKVTRSASMPSVSARISVSCSQTAMQRSSSGTPTSCQTSP